MVRVFTLIALCTLMLQVPASAQQPIPPATPADYVLVTLILRHDQSRNLEEITKILTSRDFGPNFRRKGSLWNRGTWRWVWATLLRSEYRPDDCAR